MVLGDEDYIFCACGFCGLHPLVGVNVRGIKDGGVGGTIAPLAVEEGVGGKVDDDADLKVLPGCLGGRGFDVDKVLSRRRGQGCEEKNNCAEAEVLGGAHKDSGYRMLLTALYPWSSPFPILMVQSLRIRNFRSGLRLADCEHEKSPAGARLLFVL